MFNFEEKYPDHYRIVLENKDFFDSNFISVLNDEKKIFANIFEIDFFNWAKKNDLILEEIEKTGRDFAFSGMDFECGVPTVGENPNERNKGDGMVNPAKEFLRYSSIIFKKAKQGNEGNNGTGGRKDKSRPYFVVVSGSALEEGVKHDGGRISDIGEYRIFPRDLGTTMDPMWKLLYGKEEIGRIDGRGKMYLDTRENFILKKGSHDHDDVMGIYTNPKIRKENQNINYLNGVIYFPFFGARMESEGIKPMLYINPKIKNELNQAQLEVLREVCNINFGEVEFR